MWEETPIQQLCGLVTLKLSYQVLESRLKCNQGAENQLVFRYTHVMTIEWYVYYYKMGQFSHL